VKRSVYAELNGDKRMGKDKAGFHLHNPKINKFAQKSPENLKLMVMMVALSIQQPWSAIGGQMKDYRVLGAKSRFVWGNKANTLAWLDDGVEGLHSDAMAVMAQYKGRQLDIKLMEVFIQVDGMGLAKAGFCCQLFAGRVGCIDVHNLRRYSIPESVLKFDKNLKPESQVKKIEAYVDACRQRRSVRLWNSWCELIAKKQPNKWKDGIQVSKVHLDYLTA